MEPKLAIDHLVYAVPDLAAGVEAVARRLGVRPAPGGRHPGMGTANALLALGPDAYLEVLGPDPEQQHPPRWFGLDGLDAARLVGWAVKAPDLEVRIRRSRRRGYDPGPAVAAHRRTPDGAELRWRLAFPTAGTLPCEGLIPFLIDWQGTIHPAAGAPAGCTLLDLRAEHPDPDAPLGLLRALEVPLVVAPGPRPRLIARIGTPERVVTLA